MVGFNIAATTRESAKQEAEMSDQATMTHVDSRFNDYADSLWNYTQCAEFLGMSENSLRKAAAEGRVPRLKIGRLVRFSPAAMRKWAANNMRTAVDETVTE